MSTESSETEKKPDTAAERPVIKLRAKLYSFFFKNVMPKLPSEFVEKFILKRLVKKEEKK